VKSCVANSGGATAIEYALIAGVLSIAIVGGAAAIGTALSNGFSALLAAWK
jgi:pilus assembly protein Flp/PilA